MTTFSFSFHLHFIPFPFSFCLNTNHISITLCFPLSFVHHHHHQRWVLSRAPLLKLFSDQRPPKEYSSTSKTWKKSPGRKSRLESHRWLINVNNIVEKFQEKKCRKKKVENTKIVFFLRSCVPSVVFLCRPLKVMTNYHPFSHLLRPSVSVYNLDQ